LSRSWHQAGFSLEQWQQEIPHVHKKADKELILNYMTKQTPAIYRQVLRS